MLPAGLQILVQANAWIDPRNKRNERECSPILALINRQVRLVQQQHDQVAGSHITGRDIARPRAVATLLVSQGRRPLVVTRSGTEVEGASTAGADLSQPDEAKSVLADASIVFQCAQPEYHRWEDEFPTLQRSILHGCEAAGAPLIVVENLYGYGPTAGVKTEETPMQPTTKKGRVK